MLQSMGLQRVGLDQRLNNNSKMISSNLFTQFSHSRNCFGCLHSFCWSLLRIPSEIPLQRCLNSVQSTGPVIGKCLSELIKVLLPQIYIQDIWKCLTKVSKQFSNRTCVSTTKIFVLNNQCYTLEYIQNRSDGKLL